MKKGMSAPMKELTALVVLLVAFLIVFAFQSGAFTQEKGLVHQQIAATGEIPCSRGPSIKIAEDVEGAVYLNSTGNFTNAPLKINISSSCLENLSVTWQFGDGQSLETECAYVTGKGYAVPLAGTSDWTNENCTFVNHTYALAYGGIWSSRDISVSAMGNRSGFYSEASTTGFVLDPWFEVVESSMHPDASQFSCVRIGTQVKSSQNLPLDQFSIDILDNRKLQPADQIRSGADGRGQITYRARVIPGEKVGTEHKVQVLATKGYQTAELKTPLTYKTSALNTSQEIAILSKESGGLNIYRSAGSYLDGSLLPLTTYVQIDLDTKDLDNDGAAEFVLLLADYSPTGGVDLYVQSYSGLKSIPHTGPVLPSQLRNMWPSSNLSAGIGWTAVAAGNNMLAPGGSASGNIVVLGNPGDLDLYKYSAGGRISLIERGSDFPDPKCFIGITDQNCNDWKDVATFDSGGESEIVALRGIDDLLNNVHTGDVYVFKYADYKDVKLTETTGTSYWFNISDKNWVGVAATSLDRMSPYNIVALGNPGDLALMYYGTAGPSLLAPPVEWPDVDWRDVAMVDYNRDGKDELVFLYKDSSGTFGILGIPLERILDTGGFIDISTLIANSDFNTYLGSSPDWNAMAAGDVGCFI